MCQNPSFWITCFHRKYFLSLTYVSHIHIKRIRDVTSNFISCLHSYIVYGPERGVLFIEVAWIGACSFVIWTLINSLLSEMRESQWLGYTDENTWLITSSSELFRVRSDFSCLAMWRKSENYFQTKESLDNSRDHSKHFSSEIKTTKPEEFRLL